MKPTAAQSHLISWLAAPSLEHAFSSFPHVTTSGFIDEAAFKPYHSALAARKEDHGG
jgi:hypothetical protein